jgi:polyisoprenoid-binding protein YceI
MTRLRLLALAALLSSLSASAARAVEIYKMDPQHTSVVFSVAHAGLSYTYGMFRETAGQYMIDKTNAANCKFSFVIQANSLFTNNAERDEHLRSADFFNVQQFPEISFETTRCEQVNTTDGSVVYKVTGNLTIHGVTRPMPPINVRMLAEKPGATGDHRTGFLCQVELKRSDFKMTSLLEPNLVGDAVAITVSFEGAQQDQAGAAPRTPAR